MRASRCMASVLWAPSLVVPLGLGREADPCAAPTRRAPEHVDRPSTSIARARRSRTSGMGLLLRGVHPGCAPRTRADRSRTAHEQYDDHPSTRAPGCAREDRRCDLRGRACRRPPVPDPDRGRSCGRATRAAAHGRDATGSTPRPVRPLDAGLGYADRPGRSSANGEQRVARASAAVVVAPAAARARLTMLPASWPSSIDDGGGDAARVLRSAARAACRREADAGEDDRLRADDHRGVRFGVRMRAPRPIGVDRGGHRGVRDAGGAPVRARMGVVSFRLRGSRGDGATVGARLPRDGGRGSAASGNGFGSRRSGPQSGRPVSHRSAMRSRSCSRPMDP